MDAEAVKKHLPITEQIAAAKEKDFISIVELALLAGVSERTIWRRLPQLDRVIRDGRIVRVHRVSAMRHFLFKVRPSSEA